MKIVILFILLVTSINIYANEDYEQSAPIDEFSSQSLDSEDQSGRDTASESQDFNQDEFEAPVSEESPG